MHKLLKLIGCISVSFLAGAIGGLATSANIPTWYAELVKPFFNPPNWVFGPVWSVLYLLMGISLYLVINTPVKKTINKQPAIIAFMMQLALNTLWSLIFFGLHAPEAGIAIIVGLLIELGFTIYLFKKINKTAAWLLAPYFAWICFATLLNIAIAVLN